MGYYADTVERSFIIPPEKITAALDAVNNSDELSGDTYDSLIEAVEDMTCFQECYMDEDGFNLGYHSDKYLSYTDELLAVLGPFATEGSFVRFSGEGGELFGFQVVDGKLRNEFGVIEWRVYGEDER